MSRERVGGKEGRREEGREKRRKGRREGRRKDFLREGEENMGRQEERKERGKKRGRNKQEIYLQNQVAYYFISLDGKGFLLLLVFFFIGFQKHISLKTCCLDLKNRSLCYFC